MEAQFKWKSHGGTIFFSLLVILLFNSGLSSALSSNNHASLPNNSMADSYDYISIVGSAVGGWDEDVTLTTFDGKVYFKNSYPLASGQVKFRKNKDWSENWGGSGSNLVYFGENIDVPAAGNYDITVDFNTMTYQIVCVTNCSRNIGIYGTALFTYNGEEDLKMGSTDGVNYTIQGVRSTDGFLVFREDKSWTNYWGGSEFPTGTAVQDGAVIPATTGVYDINFNLNTGEYSFLPPDVGILGSALNGWMTDIDLYSNDGLRYYLKNTWINDGQVKFRANDSWDVNWGGDDFPAGNAVRNGDDIYVTAGYYDIEINILHQTYSFTRVSNFTGAFEPSKWNFKNIPPSSNGYLVPGNDKNLAIVGSNTGQCSEGITDLTICVGQGDFSFSWSFENSGELSSVSKNNLVQWHETSKKWSNGTGNTQSVEKPLDLEPGNLIIVTLHFERNVNIIAPDGFRLISRETAPRSLTGARNPTVAAYYKIASENEPERYTFFTSGNTASPWRLFTMRLTGHNPCNPIGGISGANSGLALRNNLTIPGLGNVEEGSVLVSALSVRGNIRISTDEDQNPWYRTYVNGTSPGTAVDLTYHNEVSGNSLNKTFSWNVADNRTAAGLMFAVNPGTVNDDFAYYLINGEEYPLDGQAGIVSVPVEAGTIIGWRIRTLTNTGGPGFLIITGFNSTAGREANAGSISGPNSVIVGESIVLSSNGDQGGHWTVTPTGRASISEEGVLQGLAPGNILIKYTVLSDCSVASATYTASVAAPESEPCEHDLHEIIKGVCGQTFVVTLSSVSFGRTVVWRGYLTQQDILNKIKNSYCASINDLTVSISHTVFSPQDWGVNNHVTVTISDSSGNTTAPCSIIVLVRYPLYSGDSAPVAENFTIPETQPEIQLYPNPTSGKLSVNIHNLNDPRVSAVIYNMAGAVMLQQNYITDGLLNMDMTGMVSGIYMLRLTADGKIFTEKVVLK